MRRSRPSIALRIVVGFSSKRFSPPLTVVRSHSAPSLHDHYSFLRYYGLSDSRLKKRGPPRFLDSSILTRRPQPPRRVRWLLSPVASPPMAGFIPNERLATPTTLTRLNRVRFRCSSQVCLARLRVGDYSLPTRLRGYVDERVISTVSSFQLTRLARLVLAHR
jgi:hypothetical protein